MIRNLYKYIIERQDKPNPNTISRRQLLKGVVALMISGSLFKDGISETLAIDSGKDTDAKLKEAVTPVGKIIVGTILGTAGYTLLEK